MSTNDLPDRVRAERKRRKWTQRDLAERAGMSLRAYQNFEARTTSPQGANLRAILDAVGLDADQEGVAEATRDEWPAETRVFLDMMGVYLDTMNKAERLAFIHAETRRIFDNHRAEQDERQDS